MKYWASSVIAFLQLCSVWNVQPILAAKSRKPKSWIERNLAKDDVYAFPNSGVQVKILKKVETMKDSILEEAVDNENSDEDVVDEKEYFYYSGTGEGVKVNYSARLIDGTTIISSQEKVLNEDNTPDAFQEALEAMIEGEIWELYVPSKIANKSLLEHKVDSTKIPKGQALIFTLEFVKFMADDEDSNKISINEFNECDPKSLRGCEEWELTYAKKLNLECDHDYDCLEVEEMELKRWTGNKKTKELDTLNQKRLKILKKLMRDADENDEF
jgi:FKBP-type peptidyl-prolyl cis-trans isomerase